MTRPHKIVALEAAFTNRLMRLGPVGFILAYALTVAGVAFVVWNLLIACTHAGLAFYWTGPLAQFEQGAWSLVFVGSLMYATAQWIRLAQRRKAETSGNA